jgi:hypothetical protein
MSDSERAVRIAADLLVARLVDHDDRVVMGLVARIDDVQEARDVITALLSLVDGLLE